MANAIYDKGFELATEVATLRASAVVLLIMADECPEQRHDCLQASALQMVNANTTLKQLKAEAWFYGYDS